LEEPAVKFNVTHVPPILKPEGVKVFHEEMELATTQVLGEYRAAVVGKIEDTKPHKPVDEDTLRGGISISRTGPLDGIVTTSPLSHPYDVVQELGRRPGQPGPPLAPILAWVKRKGIATGKEAERAARAIARKLHLKGMPGRFFFRRARADRAVREKAMALVRAGIRRWKRRVA